jgi:hypothetical protein
MLNFRPILLSDKKEIDSIFCRNTYMSSDCTFTNLYTWEPLYRTVFAIEGDMLFLRFTGREGQVCYMTPMGGMPYAEAMERIVDDARQNGWPLAVKDVTLRMWNRIEQAWPGRFAFIPDRANYEYIYLSERLIKLSGKKLQSKRNFINRFKAENPEWEYVPVTTDTEISECLRMLDEWAAIKASRYTPLQEYDYLAARTTLENYHYLQIRGGALRAGGRVVAFTLGEPLKEDMFVIHTEKAFADVPGAYPLINREFAEHEAQAFKYINREEDMGLENLRKAKMSYYPDILLEKGTVVVND